jgi:hypothetical protein
MSEAPKEEESRPPPSPMERMIAFTRRIVSVPKSEIPDKRQIPKRGKA